MLGVVRDVPRRLINFLASAASVTPASVPTPVPATLALVDHPLDDALPAIRLVAAFATGAQRTFFIPAMRLYDPMPEPGRGRGTFLREADAFQELQNPAGTSWALVFATDRRMVLLALARWAGVALLAR